MNRPALLFALIVPALLAFAPPQDKQPQDKRAAPAQDSASDAAATNKAILAAQLPSYPLTTCVVSGEALDSMGGAVDNVVEGRLVRVCCKGCNKKLAESPAKYIAMVDAAVIAAQGPTYPLEICPVTGEKLGSMGKPIELVHGTRLVKLCCKGCTAKFQKDPDTYMAQVDKAYIEAQRASYPSKVCVVTGEELDADATEFLYGTQLVRVCCKKCIATFQKEPAKFLPKLTAGHATKEHDAHQGDKDKDKPKDKKGEKDHRG